MRDEQLKLKVLQGLNKALTQANSWHTTSFPIMDVSNDQSLHLRTVECLYAITNSLSHNLVFSHRIETLDTKSMVVVYITPTMVPDYVAAFTDWLTELKDAVNYQYLKLQNAYLTETLLNGYASIEEMQHSSWKTERTKRLSY